MNGKMVNQVEQLFDFMKKNQEALIPEASFILHRMRDEPGYGRDLVQAIQTYFLGSYVSKGVISDAFSIVYQRRVRFLYVLKDLFEKEEAFQKSFKELKKETSVQKMGCPVTDMERQIAFIFAGIIRSYQTQPKIVFRNKCTLPQLVHV